MKVVVDTNILIDHLRGGDEWKNFLSAHEGEDLELFAPTIVIFELFSGDSTKENSMVRKVYKLLGNFQQIDLDQEIARRAGEIFRDISHTFEIPDYIVAATALSKGAAVLTLNRKDFEKIPGLQLEDL